MSAPGPHRPGANRPGPQGRGPRFERVPRLPRLPPGSLWILLPLLGGVALVTGLGEASGREVVLCGLRRATGLPCPTCGSTRMVLAVAGGRIGEAFALNPLLMVAGCLALLALVLRGITGRRLAWDLPRRGKVRIAVLVTLLVGANWIYLLRSPLHAERAAAEAQDDGAARGARGAGP